MLRSLIATAGISLALAPLALADTETTDLVLAGDKTDNSACESYRLAYSPGSQTGSCSDATFGGYLGDSEYLDFPATDGLPLTLDTARPIHVEIGTSMFLGDSPKGAIGDETATIALSGRRQGTTKDVSLGTATQTMAAADRLGKNGATYTFDVPGSAAVAGVYKTLRLSVKVGGALLGGYVDLGGNSFVSFPIIDGTAPIPPDEG